jgi:tripartite-type tricarboxylate transporter receptor subunit TctC
MKLPRRKFLQVIGAAGLPATVQFARAEQWPSRVVRLVVGFPPGGGSDAAARIVANGLSDIWGQQVVVENKGGAGGRLAFETVARASPDGYTVLWGYASFAISRLLYSSLNFDPIADFAPVTLIGQFSMLLVVPNSSAAKSVREFIAYAKADPGKITYASPGIGTTPHLAGELFARKAGIELRHVPYRGGSTWVADLIAGRVDAMFNTSGSLLQMARAGQVRGLAVTTAERFATEPEFPTVAESGVPDFDVSGWYALFAPAKTPAEIVRKLHDDAAAMLAQPAVKARFEPLGIAVLSSTPDDLAARLRREADLWGPIIKAENIKMD